MSLALVRGRCGLLWSAFWAASVGPVALTQGTNQLFPLGRGSIRTLTQLNPRAGTVQPSVPGRAVPGSPDTIGAAHRGRAGPGRVGVSARISSTALRRPVLSVEHCSASARLLRARRFII